MATKERTWQTTREYAEVEGVTDRAVRKWCQQGKLPARQTAGGQWRIYLTEKDLKDAIRRTASTPVAATVLALLGFAA